MKKLSLILLVLGASPLAAHADDKADAILKNSTQNVFSRGEESTYVMKLEGDGSSVNRKMKVWYKRSGPETAKLLIKFQDPADIRGTGLLSLMDKDKAADQWIYIPAYKKTRRIKGGNENEAFLGSDFTIGDITNIDNDPTRYQYQVTSDSKTCGKNQCWEITGTPQGGVDVSSLPYSKKVMLIRKDNGVSPRVEFYNTDGKLEKVLEVKKIHQEGAKNWVADEMQMTNQLTHHDTVIQIQKRDASKTPADSQFTQSNLERS